MKTEVKKLDSTKCELSVAVSGELVKNKFEEVFSQIAKEAKVPGFRPGKAPRDVLEKHYASSVHEQVLKELVPDVYNQAINAEKLDVIELPQITDVKLDHNNLSFKAVVEVTPEIIASWLEDSDIDSTADPEMIMEETHDMEKRFSEHANILYDNFTKIIAGKS